jgi:hypothetical protein
VKKVMPWVSGEPLLWPLLCPSLWTLFYLSLWQIYLSLWQICLSTSESRTATITWRPTPDQEEAFWSVFIKWWDGDSVAATSDSSPPSRLGEVNSSRVESSHMHDSDRLRSQTQIDLSWLESLESALIYRYKICQWGQKKMWIIKWGASLVFYTSICSLVWRGKSNVVHRWCFRMDNERRD